MASSTIEKTAQEYLDRNKVKDEAFGLGHFLENGEFELKANAGNGSIVIKQVSGDFFDCRSLARRTYEDIAQNNPELKPRIMTYNNGSEHNWVEITCAKTGKIVQIDATPWHSSINTAHRGEDTTSEPDGIGILSKARGPPMSVRRFGERTISVYLFGYLPNASLEDKISELANHGCRSGKKPDYVFYLKAVLENGFGQKEHEITLRISIDDAAKLQSTIGTSKTMDELESNGAIETAYITYMLAPELLTELLKSAPQCKSGRREIEPRMPGGMIVERNVAELPLATLKEIAGIYYGPVEKDMRLEIEKNAERMLPLLKKCGTVLVDLRFGKVNVKTCSFMNDDRRTIPSPSYMAHFPKLRRF